MNWDKLFLAVSSIVIVVFIGFIAVVLTAPIEHSIAGTVPGVIGASVLFCLLAIPLLVLGINSWQRNPGRRTFFRRLLLIGLALPPMFAFVGFFHAFFIVFRGR
jgi:hypothetical protein